jgi:hypothetical protein
VGHSREKVYCSAIGEGSSEVRVTGTLNAGEQHREGTLSGST